MFAEKLQKLRKENHMSQEQLATKLNVSRQAVSKWEMGSLPDINNLVKISQFFDCSLDYLMHDQDKSILKKEDTITIITEKKVFKFVSVMGIIIPLCILSLLAILSIMFPAPITHQLPDGSWRYGMMGFIEYQGLETLLYFLFFIFIIGITAYFVLPLMKKHNSKKFYYYSIGAYLFLLGGWLIFFYELTTSSVVFYDFQSVALWILYGICVCVLTILSNYYRRKL